MCLIKIAFLVGSDQFLASFHVDFSSAQNDHPFIPDTSIYFFDNETTSAFLKVKLVKIHYCPTAPEASTFDKMGSLSHQIAIHFNDYSQPNAEMVYMLDPNQITFKIPLQIKQQSENQITSHSFNIDCKETWPCIQLSYEPHPQQSFIALRLYPIMGKNGIATWNEGIVALDLLRRDVSDWLSSLTDPLLGNNLSHQTRHDFEQIDYLEKSVNIIEKMHDNLLMNLSLDIPFDLPTYTKHFIGLSRYVNELERQEKEARDESISFTFPDDMESYRSYSSADEWDMMLKAHIDKILSRCV